jgi:hypothetical protein
LKYLCQEEGGRNLSEHARGSEGDGRLKGVAAVKEDVNAVDVGHAGIEDGGGDRRRRGTREEEVVGRLLDSQAYEVHQGVLDSLICQNNKVATRTDADDDDIEDQGKTLQVD